MSFKQKLQRHPLIHTLQTLERNPKLCVLTEPLFTIPYYLLQPFITLYMMKLGLTEQLIGVLLTVGMVVQVAAALVGGVLTDKLGRRFTTFVFDVLSWVVPSFIWAFAQNFWWFLAGSVINALFQIPTISWGLLLAEDTEKTKLVNINSWIQITGMLAVFFAPITAFALGKYDLVSLTRVLYVIFGTSLAVKGVLLYLLSRETRQGEIRMRETKGVPFTRMLTEYWGVFKTILSSRSTLLVLAFLALTNVWNLAIGTFFSPYATNNLQVPEQWVPIFPMVRSALMLVVMFCLQGRFNRLPLRAVLTAGLCIYLASHLLLVLAPAKNLAMLFGYVLLEGLAFSMVQPRKDSMLIWFVDEKQRARINALLYVAVIAVSSPFGAVIGWLSGIDQRLPFVLNILLFLVGILLVARSRTLREHEQEQIGDKNGLEEKGAAQPG